MDRKNAELYLKNYQIIMDNERLRRQAKRLTRENQMLLNEFHQKKDVEDRRRNTTSAAAHRNISLPDLNLPVTSFGTEAGSDPENV